MTTTLSQTINKTATGITTVNKTDGTVSNGTRARLHHNDFLVLERGTGWGNETISNVKFYGSHDDCRNDRNPVAYWKHTGGRIETSGLENKFDVTAAPDWTSVSLKDIEPEKHTDDLWYAVTIGTTRFDPEVIDRGGSATGSDPTAWV